MLSQIGFIDKPRAFHDSVRGGLPDPPKFFLPLDTITIAIPNDHRHIAKCLEVCDR